MPTIAGRDPAKVARHVKLAQRISAVLGREVTVPEVLSTSPIVPTYSTTRLAMRYLFARLGLWGGKWSSLVAMSDCVVRQRLDDYLDGLPEDSDKAWRVRRVMKRGLK